MMTKKRGKGFPKSRLSNYVQPSNFSAQGVGSSHASGTVTVNDRLAQLRLESPSKELTRQQHEIAQSSQQRSLPPSLGDVLGIPVVASPLPRLVSRTRHRTAGAFIPGPAMPKSWTEPSGKQIKSHTLILHAYQYFQAMIPNRTQDRDQTVFLLFQLLTHRHFLQTRVSRTRHCVCLLKIGVT